MKVDQKPMNIRNLSLHIKQLERKLLSANIRKNQTKLDKLIDDNFFEIGQSGRNWTKNTLIKALQKESHPEITITGFRLRLISENITLATYTAHQKPATKSFRSSIWKLYGNEWKIIFHQGTPIIN